MDEEGTRFGASLFGSRAFCGEDLSAALDARDPDGIRLGDAMAAQGRPPEGIAQASQVDRVDRYLELHIEQGPVLWSSGARVAIVDAICGVVGTKVELRGESNHAGTTPMDMRRDALVAAAEIVLALRAQAADGDELRATVGRIAVAPGGRNVIPGRCEFTRRSPAARPARVRRARRLAERPGRRRNRRLGGGGVDRDRVRARSHGNGSRYGRGGRAGCGR